eukprot:4383017-Alexandrium_andersonii.AAC.1
MLLTKLAAATVVVQVAQLVAEPSAVGDLTRGLELPSGASEVLVPTTNDLLGEGRLVGRKGR